MRDGVIVYKRVAGSASRKENVPVTEDTLFHVASIERCFTAALVLKASEERLISLDDPVAKYAPESKIGKRGTTIFDLLAIARDWDLPMQPRESRTDMKHFP